jgi:hypothetical protein
MPSHLCAFADWQKCREIRERLLEAAAQQAAE